MPFRSQAQWAWAFATGQEWADEWAKLTPGGKRKFLLLQKRVAKSKLKHLPGKHDQSKHGRDGGGGRGGISGGRGIVDASVQARVDAHFDEVIQRINSVKYLDEKLAIDLEISKKISNMPEDEQMALLDSPRLVGDGFTMGALVLYGTPKVRDRAVQMAMIDDADQNKYITRLSGGDVFANGWYVAAESSLEGKEVLSKLNNQSFMESLWFMHGTKIEGIQTAQWQMVMSQVGPNAEVPLTRTFFQPGIRPPEPQPRYVQMMNQEYQRTQEELARRGVAEVQLYRSSAYEPGIPLEPWTTDKAIADRFGKLYRQQTGKKIVQRVAKIPAKYILSTWDIAPGWPEKFVVGKQEHMIAGQAYASDTGASTTKDFASMSNKPGHGIGTDPFNYDALYDFLPKRAKPTTTRTKAISDRRMAVALKHLPGKHNQQSHGRRGGMAGGSASSSASAFNTWNDREVAKMNKDLENIINADPVTYTAEQQKTLRELLVKNLPNINIPIADAYARIIKVGMPFDTAMQIFGGAPRKSAQVDAQQLWLEHRVRDHYQEQNVRFSRMTKEKQDVVFGRLKNRVDAKDPTLTHDDMEMLVTAGLYGHPQMRMDAFTVLKSAEPRSKQPRYVTNESGLNIPIWGSDAAYATPQGAYRYYSLEARLALNTPSALTNTNLSAMPTSGTQFNADVDWFMRAFTQTHVTENTENVLGAAIQSHMSQVGPNADAPRPPSFYPRGVKTPEPNPVIVAYLQEQYRQTQAELSASGATSQELFRGTASEFRLGIPMSPWSSRKSVSVMFGDVLNQSEIPNKYVFMNHTQSRFNQTFDTEAEWLVLESGMKANSKRRKIADTPVFVGGKLGKPTYELTVKAMHEIPFDGSLLEQQYDIFYNFREKPKVKRTKEVSSHVPPQSVRDAAKRGLALRSEFNRGGTAVGIARARDLSNGKGIPNPTIKRMVSFFARHAVDKRPDWANPSKPSNGYIAHLLWGGDAGRSWANKISRQIDSERTKADDVTADGKPKRYSAGGGEVITGNLGRDSSGRFTNIRGAQALTQRVIMRGSGPKKKRGAGRAKLSPEQAKAQRDKIGKETIKKFGFSGDDYDALSNIGEEPISADSADTESVKKLIESNLAEMVGDVVALTTLGKRVLKVSQSGKAGAVREIIARDTAKREAQNKKRGEQNQSRVDKLNEQIASYEDKIADKKVKPRTRAIAERKLARAKAKLAELTTTKSRLKHLPGRHDQSKHGRDGGGGRGGISGGFSRGSDTAGSSSANPYGLKFDAPTADAPNPISLESLTLNSPLVLAAIKQRLQYDINMELRAIRKEADLIETQTGNKYTGIRDTVEHAMFIQETAKNAGLTAAVHESILTKDPRVLAIDGVSGQAFQAIVYDALGYNKRPRLVGNDELSNLTGVKTSNNGRPLIHYRGVEPNLIFSLDGKPTQLTAQDIMDDFTNGKVHYVGRGVDGNGTYMAYDAKSSDDNPPHSNARGYAGNNGVVFATAVKETAKIGTEEQYKSAVRNPRNPKNDEEVFATYFWDSMNAGTRMALLGWDGYTPDNKRFVLLNRGVAITGQTAVTEPIQ